MKVDEDLLLVEKFENTFWLEQRPLLLENSINNDLSLKMFDQTVVGKNGLIELGLYWKERFHPTEQIKELKKYKSFVVVHWCISGYIKEDFFYKRGNDQYSQIKGVSIYSTKGGKLMSYEEVAISIQTFG